MHGAPPSKYSHTYSIPDRPWGNEADDAFLSLTPGEYAPGKVLDIHYEEMVADQENQTRRILEHCGLPWEDQCLRFYETERAINTASSEQVRQPIYTKAVHFWRNYESHLGELIETLEPLLRQCNKEI